MTHWKKSIHSTRLYNLMPPTKNMFPQNTHYTNLILQHCICHTRTYNMKKLSHPVNTFLLSNRNSRFQICNSHRCKR